MRLETDRHLYRFRQNPGEYNNSEAYFRMLMMATVLQQDFGMHYNPARIATPEAPEPTSAFYANSRDVFVHGCTEAPRMGTCASLPVAYVAIGRRLKYPVHLVVTKGHCLGRWEDEKERLNFEGTTVGFVSNDETHYRKWPYYLLA